MKNPICVSGLGRFLKELLADAKYSLKPFIRPRKCLLVAERVGSQHYHDSWILHT